MKRTLTALAISGALALGSFGVYAHGDEQGGHRRHGKHMRMMGNPLEHLTKELDLTPEQQAQVTPILDQAKPQIQAIHREAKEKMRAVIENSGNQIRPLLTPQQQAKYDAIKKAHEDMMNAHKALRDAEAQ
jgi:Spy/CpxP family protein refolding chaperone